MRTSDEHLIRGFPIFRGVSDAVFQNVIAHGEVRESPPGEVLLTEGERPEHLFVLLNGLVEAFSTHAGRTATISFVRPPAAFIVAAVWMDQPQLTSVRTVQACRVLALPAGVVRDAMARDQAFCAAVGLELAIRYRDILKELKNQRMRSAGERLANWLLTECAAHQSSVITLSVSKNLLAARLGMSVEHLSRAFNHLHEHGVQHSGNEVRVDAAALTEFARPSPLMDGSDV